MYSRSRLPPSEDRYTGSIPPMYSGNRFRQVRRESMEPPAVAQTEPCPAKELTETADPETALTEESAGQAESVTAEAEKKEAPVPGIRQEDKILLAILLLLSAEHEHAMDMIVILLLLLGIR